MEGGSVRGWPRVLSSAGWCQHGCDLIPRHLATPLPGSTEHPQGCYPVHLLHPTHASALRSILQNPTPGDPRLPAPHWHTQGPAPQPQGQGRGPRPTSASCSRQAAALRGGGWASSQPESGQERRPVARLLPGRPLMLLRNMTVTNGLLHTCHLSSGGRAQPPGPAVHCQLDGGQAWGASTPRHMDIGAGTHGSRRRPSKCTARKGAHTGPGALLHIPLNTHHRHTHRGPVSIRTQCHTHIRTHTPSCHFFTPEL